MGVYMVSIGAEEWFGEDEDGWGQAAAALNAELAQKGIPPYESVPEEADFVRGSGQSFEEKLIPSMDGFGALCESYLDQGEIETLCGWTVMVPLSLEEDVWLPVGYGCTEEETMVAGAPQVLAIAERLAAVIELPSEVPQTSDNLDLTMWFRNGAAKELAALRPGPWAQDLDTSFYVALYLRAAQHSLRRRCPIAVS